MQPLTFILPLVTAPAKANVAASIRSGITRCSAPCNFLTPCIVMVGLPAPEILAPIDRRKLARSSISGSHAALWITVFPFAKVAAIIKFAVPRTVGPHLPPRKLSAPFKSLAFV